MAKYDVLWYYVGGTESGHWNRALVGPDEFDACEERLKRAGYYSRRGKLSVGPPEGPPAELFTYMTRFPAIWTY